MSRTLILILILILSTVGLLALSINNKPQSATTAVPVPIAASTLSLTAPKASTSGILTSDVVINTSSNKVMAAQLELSYNPKDITIVDVTPGLFFKTPTELIKKIDAENGRVSYALANTFGQKGISGKAIFATIAFTKLKTTGITQIDFLGKTHVSGEGLQMSVLRSTLGIEFDLSNFSPSGQATSTPSAN